MLSTALVASSVLAASAAVLLVVDKVVVLNKAEPPDYDMVRVYHASTVLGTCRMLADQ